MEAHLLKDLFELGVEDNGTAAGLHNFRKKATSGDINTPTIPVSIPVTRFNKEERAMPMHNRDLGRFNPNTEGTGGQVWEDQAVVEAPPPTDPTELGETEGKAPGACHSPIMRNITPRPL